MVPLHDYTPFKCKLVRLHDYTNKVDSKNKVKHYMIYTMAHHHSYNWSIDFFWACISLLQIILG